MTASATKRRKQGALAGVRSPLGRTGEHFTPNGRGTRAPMWHTAFPYLLIAPLVLALLLLTYLPLLSGVRLSFTDATFGGSDGTFIGFDNYSEVFGDARFWRIFYQTLVWTVLSVSGAVALGFATALALQRGGKGTKILRALVLLPWAAPPIVVAFTWRYILSSAGPVAPRLEQLGLTEEVPAVLSSQSSFMGVSTPLIIVSVLGVWLGFPFVYVFALGALSSIPPELFEAARVDGANTLQRFRWITWPLVRPVVATTTVLLSLVRFGGLDVPFLLTSGGPGDASSVFGLFIYNTAFGQLQSSLAATIGVLVFVLMLPMAVAYVRRSLRSIYR